MTNADKAELIHLVKQGYSFHEIRIIVSCSDTTIRQYLKIFKKRK